MGTEVGDPATRVAVGTVPLPSFPRTPDTFPAAPFKYEAATRLTRFEDVLDEARYTPVDDGWFIAHSDVVKSTSAIARGEYRAVNFAGAATIAAVRNALGKDVPFIFGGDGASLLVGPEDGGAAAAALAATVTWACEDLGLELRAALIPVSAVRAAGLDLRVVRYAGAGKVDYAMFAGGGLAWADAMTKRGCYAVAAAPPGARPDLAGLTCRFEAVPTPGRIVLSIIALPRQDADPEEVRSALMGILAIVDSCPAMGGSLPRDFTIRPGWSGMHAEAGAAGPLAGSLWLRKLRVLAKRTLAVAAHWTAVVSERRAEPAYGAELVANADFRKYDDGLRLTVACPDPVAEAIEHSLASARDRGLIHYGVHRQDAALVTCISATAARPDHAHFVDGADGGYAQAALRLREAAGTVRSRAQPLAPPDHAAAVDPLGARPQGRSVRPS